MPPRERSRDSEDPTHGSPALPRLPAARRAAVLRPPPAVGWPGGAGFSAAGAHAGGRARPARGRGGGGVRARPGDRCAGPGALRRRGAGAFGGGLPRRAGTLGVLRRKPAGERGVIRRGRLSAGLLIWSPLQALSTAVAGALLLLLFRDWYAIRLET